MGGQNEGCKVGMVQFIGAKRVGPNANASLMRRVLVVAWAVGAMFIIQENAAAMEDVATGRWITRDPLVYLADSKPAVLDESTMRSSHDASSKQGIYSGDPSAPSERFLTTISQAKLSRNWTIVAVVHVSQSIEIDHLFEFEGSAPTKWYDPTGMFCSFGELPCYCIYECDNGAQGFSSGCCPKNSFGHATCGECLPWSCDHTIPPKPPCSGVICVAQ